MNLFEDLSYHATLESQLLEDLSLEQFEKLDLPLSTYPKTHQLLPRTSSKKISAPFSSLPIIKKRLLDKAILSLYQNYGKNESHSISLLTYVVPGGLGDYFFQKLAKQLLEKAFPLSHFYSHFFIHRSAPETILKNTEEITVFDNAHDLHPARCSIASKLSSSQLVLQLPTFYPYSLLLAKMLSPHTFMESIGEYGFIHARSFHPSTHTRVLGLHPLEHGLLLEDFSSFHPEIKNKHLKPLLSNRNEKSHLYFAYLCTEYGYELYLYTIILLHAKDSCNIDLFTIDIGPYLQILSKGLVKTPGIKEILIIYHDYIATYPISSSGKTLRLIHTGPLDHSDFKSLLHLSKEPVGVRGNLSLTEVISMNKAYLYDPLDHNLSLYYSLKALAKERAPAIFESLSSFKKQGSAIDAAEKLCNAIEKAQALEAFKAFNSILQEEHSANIHLINLVSRSLFYYKNPKLLVLEKQLIAAYLKKQLSFEDFILKLRSMINNHSFK